MLVDLAVRLREVDVGQASVVRAAGGDHDVVDRGWQVLEEPREACRIGGVEGCAAQGAELSGDVLQALGIAAGEDDVGPFGACPAGCFEPDPGAAANDHDGLPEQFRLTLDRSDNGCGAHRACIAHLDSAPICSRGPAISLRSAFTPAR